MQVAGVLLIALSIALFLLAWAFSGIIKAERQDREFWRNRNIKKGG